jgi:hypothetical protein
MAEIGIHGLAAGHDQHQRAQSDKRIKHADMLEKSKAVERIERRQNLRTKADLPRPQRRNDDKPDNEHRAENNSDAGGALVLNSEQHSQ